MKLMIFVAVAFALLEVTFTQTAVNTTGTAAQPVTFNATLDATRTREQLNETFNGTRPGHAFNGTSNGTQQGELPRKVVEYLIKNNLDVEPAFVFEKLGSKDLKEMPCPVLKSLARKALTESVERTRPAGMTVSPLENIDMKALDELPCSLLKYLIQKNLDGEPASFEKFDEKTLKELPCPVLRFMVRVFVLNPIEEARREGKPFPFGNNHEEVMREFMHRVISFLAEKTLGSDFPYDKVDDRDWEEVAHKVFEIMGRKGWEGKPDFPFENFDETDLSEFKEKALEIVARKDMHEFMHKVISFLAEKTLGSDFPYDKVDNRDWEEVAHKVFEIMGRKGWNGELDFPFENFDEDDLGEFKKKAFEIVARKKMSEFKTRIFELLKGLPEMSGTPFENFDDKALGELKNKVFDLLEKKGLEGKSDFSLHDFDGQDLDELKEKVFKVLKKNDGLKEKVVEVLKNTKNTIKNKAKKVLKILG